uniref:uncharacterized protein LOC113475578 n=1 Tax=Ciona intestinalis TaxID=7719 RepID=UPI000EF4A317|nr:uncharacterized protein LOC113475578 [Ciona intestinalis]|eukprot:XP_026695645.1 uncharacterized protein LOC113475578 [Ciona intestinalis]
MDCFCDQDSLQIKDVNNSGKREECFDDRMSQDSVLSPEHLVHASDPNVVLTDPVVLDHLRKLHNRATKRGQRQSIDDDIQERRAQLRVKVDNFNRRSEIGAFRVKLLSVSLLIV